MTREQKAPPAKRIQRIGSYDIGKTLGHGSFGKVKLATHCATKEKVAVKFFKHHKFTTAQQLENCNREIDIMKLLNHPNIVKLIDVVEKSQDGMTYLIVEYVVGGELFDYIVANGVVKEKEARRFFRQIVSAVEYCHANLIVHRDLKPENLLLDAGGNIKISDFGLSNVIEPGKLLDSFCGSPLYAAPEILLAERYVGPPVDVWSMGVILYALLCGHLPWSGDTQAEISHNSVRGIYEEPEALSRTVRDLIRKMLNPSPTERITIDDIRRHAWINETYTEPPPSLLTIRQPVHEVREEILFKLFSLGYRNKEENKRKILGNECCQVVAIYHLLLDRIVEEEMTEIKKKLLNSKPNQVQQNQQAKSVQHVIVPAKTPDIVVDPRERRLSSPTKVPKMAVIPEDEDAAKAGSWRRDKYDDKPEERRGSVADGRSVLTSSAPIPRPDKPNGDKSHHRRTTPAPIAPVDPQAVPRWQHRRASVACPMEPDNRTPRPAITASQQQHRPAPYIIPDHYEHANDGRKYSLDARAFAQQMAQETPAPMVTMANNPIVAKLASSSSTVLGPRLVKGVFKSSTTTSRAPEDAAKTVKKCLGTSDMLFKRKNPYTFLCLDEESGVKMQVEVCKILQLDLTGIHFKRVSGDIWKYKALCNDLVCEMKF